MPNYCPWILLLLLSWWGSLEVVAQRPDARGRNFPDPDFQQDSVKFDLDGIVEDTMGVNYFYLQNPEKIFSHADTLLDDFQRYRPTRLWELNDATLGNFGSAHYPLLYESPQRKGFDIGWHQFDRYYILPENIKYYNIQNPFSQVAFSRSANQSDSYFKGDFARNFSDGLSISVSGKLLRQLGLDDQYQNQGVVNESFGTTLHYESPSKKYRSYFYFISNETEQEENGGLVGRVEAGDNAFGQSVASDTVRISEGTFTRHVHRSVSYKQYLNVVKTDTATGVTGRPFLIGHQVTFKTSGFKYFDTFSDTTFRSLVYGDLATLDDRGLRVNVDYWMLENDFSLSSPVLTNNKDSVATKLVLDRIEVGVRHQFHRTDQEISENNINNLFVTGRFGLRLKNSIALDAYAHLGLLSNVGDYKLAGDLFFDVGKVGKLTANFTSQAYEPTLVQQSFVVSKQQIWGSEQDLRKTIETSLSGTYELLLANFRATAHYRLIDNYIFFDEDGRVRQLQEPLNILQLVANQQLNFWKFRFKNQVALQATTQDVIRLPDWYTKHSLYFDGSLFKSALNLQIGIDAHLFDSFFANYYSPLTGQFQLQNEQELGQYALVDAFLNIKIQTLRFFIKAENLTELIQSSENRLESSFFYQTAFYPQPLFLIRFGLDWRLFN